MNNVLVKSLFNRLVSAGTIATADEFFNERIRQFNISLFAGAVFVLINTAFVFWMGLPYTTLLDIGYFLVLLIAYLLNRFGYYSFSVAFSFISTNVFLLVASYIEGRFAGNYLLFIPLTVILALLVRLKQNPYQLLFLVLVMIGCMYLSFTFCPPKSVLQPVPDEQYFSMYLTNIATSIAITAAFSFVLYRINANNEKKLVMEKEYVKMLFNTSVEAVFLVNKETRTIQDCNQRAIDLFELKDKAAVINRPLKEIRPLFVKNVFENGKEIDAVTTVTNESWNGEVVYKTASGKEFTADVSIISFLYNKKNYLKVSVTDISKLKKTEHELRAAKEKAEDSSHAKSRFLSNMSHELRTPLNGIIGTTNLLLDEDTSPALKEHLDVLKFSSEHMLHLVNDVLDYSRLEDGNIRPEQNHFNLYKTAEKILTVFQPQFKAKRVNLVLDADDIINTMVVTDATRLMQILSNLLSNALKFTRKGEVTVSLKAKEIKSNELAVEFSVADTGIGISAEMQQQVFERFTQAEANTTRRFGGTGLGLAICKMLTELLGGKLQLESELNKGSRFYFTLRMARKENGFTTTLMPVNNDFVMKDKRVLVAEDNPVNMKITKRFLEKWGASVTEAVNGIAAVEAFTGGEFDLLLLDLEMPEMDGYAALQSIRKINTSVPAIAFTAAVYENMMEDLQTKGFTDFLPKPFNPQQLQQIISKHAM